MDKHQPLQIADILPPTVPLPSVDQLFSTGLLLAVLVTCLIIAGIYYLTSEHYRRRLQFKFHLWRLHKQYQQNKLNNRQCALLLSALLHRYKNETDSEFLADTENFHTQSWHEYLTILQTACFSAQGANDKAITWLLCKAETLTKGKTKFLAAQRAQEWTQR